MSQPPTQQENPLETIFNDVHAAIHARIYYAAVVVSLTIPEICAALESPDGTGGSTRYKNWYDRYLASTYQALSADDCYSLRCSVLHQGKMGRPGMTYSRVLFTLPDSAFVMHNNILMDALNLDVGRFCNDVISSAKNWFADHAGSENVQRNLQNLVRFRANGIAPYMAGIPVIS